MTWKDWSLFLAADTPICLIHTSHLKKRILVQDRDGFGIQTASIRLYVEDLNPESNKDIGPKDFFEMACSYSLYRVLTLTPMRGLGIAHPAADQLSILCQIVDANLYQTVGECTFFCIWDQHLGIIIAEPLREAL